MPGVLQVEAMAQLGGIILMDPEKDAASQQNFFFGGIEGCKFRRPVVPGDTLVSLKSQLLASCSRHDFCIEISLTYCAYACR